MQRISKQYLAGFIDGEGCITFRRCTKHGTALVNVCNTCEKIINLIQKDWSGNIGVSQSQKNNHKKVLRLTWCGEKALTILKAVLPYLVIKNTQASLLLEYYRKYKPHMNKRKSPEMQQNLEKLTTKIRRLNKRGI